MRSCLYIWSVLTFPPPGTLAQTAPQFRQDMYTISVNESNEDSGFPRPPSGFLTVTCIDPTTNTTPTAINYTISDDSLPFAIDDSSGALSVTQDLDYDIPPRLYEFNVTCYNDSLPELADTALVSVILEPVNDNIPRFSRSTLLVFINEFTLPGTKLVSTQPGARVMYSVSDADVGIGNNITFTLSETSESPLFFTLDAVNGTLILTQSIDVESTNQTIVHVRITACDTSPPREQCPNLPVTVIVLAINDNLPEFSNDSYSASFPETTPNGTVLVTAECRDGDRPGTTGAFFGIALSNPTQTVVEHFMVDSDTGRIVLIQELDYETEQSFNFTVVCSDNGGRNTFAQVIIDVIPENDNFPMFINGTLGSSAYNFSISRTVPVGYVVSQITATDADIGITPEAISYSIEPNKYYSIDNITGVVSVTSSVVNATSDILTLNVTASDGTLISSVVVIFVLTPGNFDQPEFQTENLTLQVNEVTSIGTTIETVLCTDTDSGSNAAISYSITSGSELFQINSTSGAILVASSLLLPDNASAIVTHTLNIRCEDGGIPILADNTFLFVQVYMDDSNPPIINDSSTIVYVSEDTRPGQVIETVAATDADTAELSFRLVNESAPGTFAINNMTGAIILNETLDRELISVYQLTVVVVEVREVPGDSQSDSVEFTVCVLDVNDNSPQFINNSQTVTINDLTPTGTNIASVLCIDNDIGTNAEISYLILPAADTSMGLFRVSDGGNVTVSGNLRLPDFVLSALYNLTIQCSDNGQPPLNDTALVTVYVDKVDFEPPVINNTELSARILENTPVGTVVYTIDAYDVDSPAVNITLQNEAQPGVFIINDTNSIVLNASLDRESQDVYNVTVVVTEVRSTPGDEESTTAVVTIHVEDINDNTPVFLNPNPDERLNDQLPNGTEVTTIMCTDQDVGTNAQIVYSFVGNTTDNFAINQTSGNVSVARSLVLSENVFTVNYSLTVRCEDRGSPSLTNETTLSIQVYKADTNPPAFANKTVVATVAENATLGQAVITISASDTDSPGLDYRIENESAPGVFAINSSTGVITVAQSLDRETIGSYELTIVATENRIAPGMPQSDMADVTVLVQDVNDNPPQFINSSQTVTINDLTPTGTNIASVLCTDNDIGTNPEISYRILLAADTPMGLFRVSDGGNVTVSRDLRLPDFVLSALYNLTIQCSDNGQPSLNDTAQVTVYVDKVDFEPPVINNTELSAQILENATVGTVVYTIDAYDVDSPAVNITLQNEPQPGVFIISDTNSIVLNAPLDRESQDVYNVTVVVTEVRSTPGDEESTTAVVTIHVEDINDNTPAFFNPNPDERLNDQLPNGTEVTTIMCTDRDVGTNAQTVYSFVGNATDNFAINQTSGNVSVARSLVLSENVFTVNYSLTVRCEDRGSPSLTNETTLSIQVYKADTNPPAFANKTVVATVAENATLGQAVITISASDTDSPGLDYRIENESAPGVFAINSSTGVITVAQSLDRETIGSYELTIVATENRIAPGMPQSDMADVTVLVQDVNDNPPQFINSSQTVTINDLTPTGTNIASVLCTDNDIGTNAEISYRILPAADTPMGLFRVSDGGNVTVSRDLHLPDFVLSAQYNLTIQCSDNGQPSLNDTALVTVYVDKVDFEPPVINNTELSTRILENATVGTVVYTIDTYDVDSPAVNITLQNEAQPGVFIISDTNSIVLNVPLDRESQDVYNVTVVVTEVRSTPGDKQSTTAVVTIHVEDVNDNTPAFLNPNPDERLNDQLPNGTEVTTIMCTDRDVGTNAQIVYSFVGIATDNFAINQTSGNVSVARSLVLSENVFTVNYSLTVRCEDRGLPSLTNETTLSIQVYKADTNPPAFANNTVVATVAENATLGQAVITISASDTDSPSLDYRIENESAPGVFAINSSTGIITVAQSLDRETIGSYELTIVATENRIAPGMPQSDMADVTILVQDVNDNSPQFINSSQTVAINDLTPTGTNIASVLCTDNDIGTNAEISYRILPAADTPMGLFRVSDGGNVTVSGNLRLPDFVLSAQYNLTIQCSDNGQPSLNDTALVTVYVDKVDFEPPVINNTELSTRILENATVGTVVYTIDTYDVDSPAVNITLQNEAQPGVFIISDTNSIVLNASLDRESQDVYNVTVVVTEVRSTPGDKQSTTAVVTIHVEDVNDNTPAFLNPNPDERLNDQLPNGTEVTTIMCTDRDVGTNAQIVYSFVGIATDNFAINQTTGVVSIARSLVLSENVFTVNYSLTVRCEDRGSPSLTNETTLSIQVYKADTNPPTFANKTVVATVAENATLGQAVITISASDTDSPSLDYRIENESAPGVFAINSSTGIITVAQSLDRETIGSYELTIVATENRIAPGMPQSDTADVTILVQDVNDNSPQFINSSQTVAINDLTPTGTNIASVLCTDNDIGTNAEVSYRILPAADTPMGLFRVSDGGNVTVSGNLRLPDFVLSAQYNLTIQCSDNGQPSLNDTALVTVYVDKVDFEPPVINNTELSARILENATVGTVVYTIDTYDVDSPAVNITLQNEAQPGVFIISDTNSIVLNASLDRESQDVYNVTVVVTEVRSTPGDKQSTTAVVTIHVEDVNDNTPAFLNPNPDERLNDQLPNGTEVTTIMCTDRDVGTNAQIVYSFVGNATDNFAINQTTGVVSIARSLVLSENVFTVNYSLIVRCEDRGSPSLTNETTLSIQVYKADTNPPAFANKTVVATVAENATLGQAVITISASDTDSPGLDYRIENESAPGVFAINSSTGVITVAQSLDRETIGSYELTIVATENRIAPGMPQSDTADVTILVQDVNDNSPQCQNTSSALSSTIRAGTYDNSFPILNLSCNDSDLGSNQVLTYTFVQNTLPQLDAGRFVLNETSGQLLFEGTLASTAIYNITILVSDSGVPSQSTQVLVQIEVAPPVETTAPPPLTTAPPTIPPPSAPRVGLLTIVSIVVGFLLFILLLTLCIVCCYWCNRERVRMKQKILLRWAPIFSTEPVHMIQNGTS